MRPDHTEYATYYDTYISLVDEDAILPVLEAECQRTVAFLRAVPEREVGRHHLTYTWTLRQVLGHMLDTERVFAYRALCFARGEQQPLPGFDENAYVAQAVFDECVFQDMVDEFACVRRSHTLMLGHLPPPAWDRCGRASDCHFTVRALAYCMVGHERHHMNIVRKRLATVV